MVSQLQVDPTSLVFLLSSFGTCSRQALRYRSVSFSARSGQRRACSKECFCHGFPKHLFLVNSVRANRGKALVFVDGCLPFLPGIVKNVFLVSSACANRRGLAQKNVFVNSVSLNVRGFGAFALFFCAFAFFQSRGMAF